MQRRQITGYLTFLIISFFIPTTIWAASVTLKWQANKEADISSYNIYYGKQSRDYGPPIPAGNVTSYTVDDLEGGTAYYFALTAVDTSGNESGYSAEIVHNAENTDLQSFSLSTDLASPQPEGQPIELTAEAIESNEVYEYQFLRRKYNKKKWKVLRDFSTESQFTWDTSGQKGKWDLKVVVRSQNNPSTILAIYKINNYKISSNVPTSVSLSSNLQSPQPSGTTISLQADAVGGLGSYEYAYQIRKKKNGEWRRWKTIETWSSSSDYSWSASEIGKFRIRTLARIEGASSGNVKSSPITFTIE